MTNISSDRFFNISFVDYYYFESRFHSDCRLRDFLDNTCARLCKNRCEGHETVQLFRSVQHR